MGHPEKVCLLLHTSSTDINPAEAAEIRAFATHNATNFALIRKSIPKYLDKCGYQHVHLRPLFSGFMKELQKETAEQEARRKDEEAFEIEDPETKHMDDIQKQIYRVVTSGRSFVRKGRSPTPPRPVEVPLVRSRDPPKKSNQKKRTKRVSATSSF